MNVTIQPINEWRRFGMSAKSMHTRGARVGVRPPRDGVARAHRAGRYCAAVRHFTLIRHGKTVYNVEGLLNGDPSVPVHLTDEGQEQALGAREVVGGESFDVAVRTRFPRTLETLLIVLDGRDVPIEVFPELDDQHVGQMEGRPVGDYRRFRTEHGIEAAPPGGESRLDALARYVDGYQRLVDLDAEKPIVVTHDVTIRFMANAARGQDPIRGPIRHVPNASVTRLSEPELRTGLEVMRDHLKAETISQ